MSEAQGHLNAYYMIMPVFCYESSCMNRYRQFFALILSCVSFVALFEPCFGQHLKKIPAQFRVPKSGPGGLHRERESMQEPSRN